MKVTVIKHKDVRGTELLYLKLENENGEYLMNIGKKSFETIEELLKHKEVKNEPKKMDK